MRHAPQDRIVKREIAEAVANTARDFQGALAVRVQDKRQVPPKLHDLPSLQKLCSSRFGWSASKTLELAFACQIAQKPSLTGPHFAWRGAHRGFDMAPQPENDRIYVRPVLASRAAMFSRLALQMR